MTQIHAFTFNPFAENTYLLVNEQKECIIIDPGCYSPTEKKELSSFISDKGLQPVKLILTHCHIDHILGNGFVYDTYGLAPVLHRGEIPYLDNLQTMAGMYGMPADPSPAPTGFLEEGEILTFGNQAIRILLTPGHSPASICLYCAEEDWLIAGDVLFDGSIGRTDLPGGDYDILIESIEQNLLTLPDSTNVYPGHGPATTIGKERRTNPFLQGERPF